MPLLVVGTARPELLARRTAWGGGKTNALTLSLAPLSGNGDRGAGARASRAGCDPRRHPGDAPRACRRQPAVRGGVRPLARRARERRRTSGDRPGHHRRPPRRPHPQGKGAAAGRCRSRSHVLGRRARGGAGGGRRGAPSPRATGVRPARAPEHRRRRDGIRVPACPRPRGRVRADSAGAAWREAPQGRRLARKTRPARRSCRAPRASLHRGARLLGARRRARGTRCGRPGRSGRPGARAQRVRSCCGLLPPRARHRRREQARHVAPRTRQRARGARGWRGCRSSHRRVGDAARRRRSRDGGGGGNRSCADCVQHR